MEAFASLRVSLVRISRMSASMLSVGPLGSRWLNASRRPSCPFAKTSSRTSLETPCRARPRAWAGARRRRTRRSGRAREAPGLSRSRVRSASGVVPVEEELSQPRQVGRRCWLNVWSPARPCLTPRWPLRRDADRADHARTAGRSRSSCLARQAREELLDVEQLRGELMDVVVGPSS